MPKLSKELTAKQVKKLSQIGGHHSVGGVKGLTLYVVPNKSGDGFHNCWVFRNQSRDGSCCTSLGQYPDVSLAQAKKMAKVMRAKFNLEKFVTLSGVTSVQSTKAVLKRDESISLGRLIDRFIENQKNGWKHGNRESVRVRSVLRAHLKPLLQKEVAQISSRDLASALTKCYLEKYPTFEKNLPRIQQLFVYAQANEFFDQSKVNPADKNILKVLLPKRVTKQGGNHQPYLAIEEIPRFFKELQKYDYFSAECLKFTILTCVRAGNSRLMTWDELNDDLTVWTIPKAKMKVTENGQHVIPLSTQASAILRKMRDFSAGDDFVFPGRSTGTPLADTSMTMLIRRMHEDDLKMGNNGWYDASSTDGAKRRIAVPHGIARASFHTWVTENSIADQETIDLVLHHGKEKIASSYNHAKKFEAKKQTLQKWADFCCSKCG